MDTDKDTPPDDKATETPTKPAGQDVGPPDERVDDEAAAGAKTTRRQE